MLETFLQDIRYAVRLLRRSPLFTATAALSLAIGIGANTTIFSVASALLLRPLPGLAEPDRLVDVGRTQDGHGFDTVSYPNYRDLRERTKTLAGLYAYRVEPQPMSLATQGDTERIYGNIVTANYFTVLGAHPHVGRLLHDGDDAPDSSHTVVVLSHVGLGGIKLPGRTPPRGEFFDADWNVVEPGLFRTLKLPLTRGRDFTDGDTAASQPVAIVNEALVAQYWPGEDPLGKQMIVQGDGPPRTVSVVGVAADARLIWLTGPVEPYVYVPFAQRFIPRVALLVRTRDDRRAVPEVRALLRSMNPNLPITQSMRLSEVTAIGLIPQRIAASVAGTMGIIGLLLAAIGIYGVTSYAVSRRTREIGMRIALGADHGNVIRLVLRQGLMLAAIGVAIGVVIAAVGSKFLESLLFGVRGLDPVAFAGACLLFSVVTLVASYVPARRATTVDPMVALRNE